MCQYDCYIAFPPHKVCNTRHILMRQRGKALVQLVVCITNGIPWIKIFVSDSPAQNTNVSAPNRALQKHAQGSFITGSKTELTLLLLLIVGASSLFYLLTSYCVWMGNDRLVYPVQIWPGVLKYASCGRWAGELGSGMDFGIVLIGSLANNMKHVTFECKWRDKSVGD